MQAMVYQNLILLTIILSHLSIHCDASRPICSRNGMGFNPFERACSPPRLPERTICNMRVTLCRLRNTQYSGFIDCLRSQFKCFGRTRCIPSTLRCNGVKDCRDGSDEWGCDSSSMDSTIMNRKYLESEGNITLYIKTEMSKLFLDFGVTTTTKTDTKSEDNTSSPPPAPTTLLSQSESNDGFQSSPTRASAMIQDTDSSTVLPLSTTGNANSTNKTDPESEDNASSPPPITSTSLSQYESNDSFQSSPTRVRAMIQDSDSNTAFPLSTTVSVNSINQTDPESEGNASSPPTIISILLSQSESNDGFQSSTTRANAMIQDSDLVTALPLSTKGGTVGSRSELNSPTLSSLTTNTKVPFSRDASTIIPEFKEDTSFLETSTVFPESSTIQLCPDNYCMQNAECIVIQGQYQCNCPSSFIGELCEIQLDNEEAFHEYSIEMAISITLAILCLAVVLMCIYRIKRSSSWKFRDGSSKTLSQSTLTTNAVE